MLQNIKVDIIYYKTNTDFEMEFNLCGCCRMRLLTDKAPDKKTMVHSLARAVSRSRVIIIVGNLFGESGVTRVTAAAIGSNVATADNKTYGISGEDKIEIINGSVPLVTPEGYFGGCIIESGPQTLVLLSENKNIRKSVMKNLIHPYIEELSSVEPDGKVDLELDSNGEKEAEQVAELLKKDDDTLPEISEVPSKIEDETDYSDMDKEVEAFSEELDLILNSEGDEIDEALNEDIKDLIADDDEITMSPSGEDGFEIADKILVDSELLIEEDTINRREYIARNSKYYEEQETVRGLLTDEEDKFEYKKSRFLNLPIFIVAIFVLAVIAILCYHIFYVPATQGDTPENYIREIFNTMFG